MLDLLFPPVCFACRVLLRAPAAGGLCPRCALELVPRPKGSIAPLAYEGPPRQALTDLKYARDLAMVGPLGGLLADALAKAAASVDAIVPVPLHPSRQRQRGFNQTRLIVHAAQRKCPRRHRKPVVQLLRRVRATAPQVALGPAARRSNVHNAFALPARSRPLLRGHALLVVDDVVTTGATLAACTDALASAGARVSVLALMEAVA